MQHAAQQATGDRYDRYAVAADTGWAADFGVWKHMLHIVHWRWKIEDYWL
jgi:hypothetical protein